VPQTTSFGGSFLRVACSSCNLLGTLDSSIDTDEFTRQLAQHGVHLRFEPDELQVELVARGSAAVRVTHIPTGFAVESQSYPTELDNERAALQAIALQIRAREEEALATET
jgi:hypothetical protein